MEQKGVVKQLIYLFLDTQKLGCLYPKNIDLLLIYVHPSFLWLKYNDIERTTVISSKVLLQLHLLEHRHSLKWFMV